MALKELRQKLGQAVTEARAMHDAAEKEDRGFTAEERTKWDKINADIEELRARIADAEKAGSIILLSEQSTGVRTLAGAQGNGVAANGEPGELEKRAFGAYLRAGMGEMPDELRDIARRSFTAGTNNTGGYTVPQAFYNQLEVALKAFGGMMQAAEIIRTDTGATLPMPTFNYTNVSATIIGEGSGSSTDSNTPFGVVNMGAYTYRSPLLPVSYEFLQDTAFSEQYIIDALGQSIARGYNAHATNTGNGTTQPQAIVGASAAGKVGATGHTTDITYLDLLALYHSVDPAYRNMASFMMNDASLKTLRSMVDSNNRPIFLPGFDGLSNAMSDTVMGKPAVINQDMPTMAANAKSILFGALNKYKVRIARDVQVLRLVERYADQLQVAFLVFARMDGKLLDAGTNPVKYYQNSAT